MFIKSLVFNVVVFSAVQRHNTYLVLGFILAVSVCFRISLLVSSVSCIHFLLIKFLIFNVFVFI
jgi:hypothetical protein